MAARYVHAGIYQMAASAYEVRRVMKVEPLTWAIKGATAR